MTLGSACGVGLSVFLCSVELMLRPYACVGEVGEIESVLSVSAWKSIFVWLIHSVSWRVLAPP